VSKQLDDQGFRPLPKCQRCSNKVAVWVVTPGKVHTLRILVCSVCARSKELKQGKRRALHPEDY
jgi:hypothetical protein